MSRSRDIRKLSVAQFENGMRESCITQRRKDAKNVLFFIKKWGMHENTGFLRS